VKQNTIISFLILALLFLLQTASPGAVSARNWKQATGQRSWSFPKDHGVHPDYRTEWWYFTGNLVDDKGGKYGYQLTFFRQGIRREINGSPNAWSVADIYLAHFAVADINRKAFWFSEQTSRTGPGLAGARPDAMDVWCLNWSARMDKGRIFLEASREDVQLKLELMASKQPVFHGEKGLSKKGALPGQASWYYSFTDLQTKGTLRTKASKKQMAVSGTSWFDQEFGSNQLAEGQVGWDWFALHLSDGRDLMLYMMRKKDGAVEPSSSGTLIEKDGRTRHLKLAEISLDVLDYWKSHRSGARYPARWRITIPSADLKLDVFPLISDQELDTAASTGVVYYEGAIAGAGQSLRTSVSCEGYVEMTGYAGSLGGIF
jgi:predicted secreted hydrolase